jgi:hypothetical protein
MKVEKLEVKNILGARHIQVIPTGAVVELAGNNEAGKSSSLAALAMALGGARLVPDKPIREGEQEGTVEADIGDFIITRRVWIDPDSKQGKHKTSLKIISKEKGGAKLNQSALSDLLVGFAFDPLSLSQQDPRTMAEKLKALAGPEFVAQLNKLEQSERAAYDYRSEVTSKLRDIGHHEAPEKVEPVDVAALTSGVVEAQEFNLAQDDRRREIEARLFKIKNMQSRRDALQKELDELGSQIAAEQEAFGALPRPEPQKDLESLKARLASAQDINAKAAAYKRWEEIEERAHNLAVEERSLTSEIEAIRKQKLKLFAEADLPVEGLGFSEDGLTLDGIPIKQLSSSQAWRTWVKIGIAMLPKPAEGKPALRIMFVRDGSLLDQKSFKTLLTMAEENDCQLWIETVGQGHGNAVLIDEGEVVDLEEWKRRYLPSGGDQQ